VHRQELNAAQAIPFGCGRYPEYSLPAPCLAATRFGW